MPKFKHGWTDNPTPPGRRDKRLTSVDAIPAYRRASDGGVGEPIGEPVDQADQSFPYVFRLKEDIGVDPQQSALAPDGGYLVLAMLPGGEQVWLQRSYLADPHYEPTTKLIEARAGGDQTEESGSLFWWERRQRYVDAGEVTVTQPLIAKDFFLDEPYRLEAGTYRLVGPTDARVSDSQQTPFSLNIVVGETTVTVNPDLLEVEESHVESAKEKQLDASVPAERVREVFDSAPDVVRRYVPRGTWLTDDHIHYVTADGMGAVYVLRKKPAPSSDVTAARRKNSALFQQGRSASGVRIGLDIYIQESQRGTGVEFHEAVHLLSAERRGLLDVFGPDFNEGVTEYLTRLVLAQAVAKEQVVRSDDAYLVQRLGVEALIEARLFSQEELAAAYFQGKLQSLFSGTAARMGEKAFSLQGYAARIGSEYSFAAREILQKALTDA